MILFLLISFFVIEAYSILLSYMFFRSYKKKGLPEVLGNYSHIFIKQNIYNEMYKKFESQSTWKHYYLLIFIQTLIVFLPFFLFGWKFSYITHIIFIALMFVVYIFSIWLYVFNLLKYIKLKEEIASYWTLRDLNQNVLENFSKINLIVNKKDFFITKLAKKNINKKINTIGKTITSFEEFNYKEKVKIFNYNYQLLVYFFSYFHYNKEKLNESNRNLFNDIKPFVINYFGTIYVGNNGDVDFLFETLQNWYSNIFK